MGLGIGLGIVRNVAGDEEAEARARRELETLQAGLAAQGIPLWTEAGALPRIEMRRHVSSFPYSFLHYLRRVYALQRAGREITPARDPSDLERDDAIVEDETSLFSSHLLCHSDTDGYYVPVDFEDPRFLPSELSVAGAGIVGSSQGLLRELRELAPALGIALAPDGALPAAEAARLYAVDEDSPWFHEQVVWLALHEVCSASVRYQLTVVFC